MKLSETLDNFEPISNKIEKKFFKIIIVLVPTVYIARVISAFIYSRLFATDFYSLVINDFVGIITQVAFLVFFFFANSLMNDIPYTLNYVFQGTSITEEDDIIGQSKSKFVENIQKNLNSSFRIVMGCFSAIFIIYYHLVKYDAFIARPLSNYPRMFLNSPDYFINFIADVLFSYCAGIVAWKIIVMSISLQALPNKFILHAQLTHPDRAGGFLPVGLLCLKMTYLSITPSLLSFVLIILSFTQYLKIVANDILLYVFIPLLLCVGFIGTIICFAPIFSFHRVLVTERNKNIDGLKFVASQLIKLKKNAVQMMSSENLDDFHKIINQWDNYEKFFNELSSINLWPINKEIVIKIIATQTFLIGQAIAFINLVQP